MKYQNVEKLLLISLMIWSCSAMALAAPADVEHNEAEDALLREQRELQEEAARREAGLQVEKIVVPVEKVEIIGNERLSENNIRIILPELYKNKVSIHKLAQQLQMANESGAASFHADFHDGSEPGKLAVTLTVKEGKHQYTSINIANTGNEYTGDWRSTINYINTNLSGRLDSLGVAWVTGLDHFNKVQQGAFSYRWFQPGDMSSWNISGGYAKADLGNVSPDELKGILDYTAKGESYNISARYQHYLAYTSRERDSWTVGLDYQRSVGRYGYTFYSTTPYSDSWVQDYRVTTASLSFQHLDRGPQHVFYWDAGFMGNLDSGGAVYQAVTPGCADRFTLIKGNLLYQYRTNSNWIFGTRWQGQYTRQHLVSLAQLGAGGQYTVRGFEERALSADYGIIGSLEIYTPEICKGLRLVAFSDFAAMANNNNANSISFAREKFASAGLGLRYTDENSGLSISLDYAKILNDVSYRQVPHYHWILNCNYRF